MEENTNVRDPRRSFVGPDRETTYYIANPNAEDIRGADWLYSKTYTKCLVEGITTAAEMQDILMRRGVIGPQFEQRANELASNLNEKIYRLESSTNIEDKRNLAIDVATAREELFQWNQRLNGPLSNTCEQISDDARLEHLTSSIAQAEDGTRLWKSYEDYKTDTNQSLTMRARFEVMLYLQGMDSTFLEKTPEAMAMREVEADIIDRAKQALNELEIANEALESEVPELVEPTKVTTKKVKASVAKTSPKNKDSK